MRIRVKKEKCSGCHLCETICSLYHFGFVNTEKSAIRIEKDDLDTSLNAPLLCRQCKNMQCLSGEIIDAKKERRLFIWDKSRAERCPFHALQVFDGCAYHCDLCGGKPQCLKVCTTGALFV